jgi:glycosyltransferase involved in cell wall biosynthesis
MSGAEPALTVVMPVHNALPYLDAAVASILGQTHHDFIFVIYDDCSTDGSYERLVEIAANEPRIKLHRGSARLGPRESSHVAAGLAQSEFVARRDADDIAHPERLALELAALRGNPRAVLVGATPELIDGPGRILRRAAPSRIGGSAPPFAHPSIMYRREAFDAAGGYRPDTDYFEDLDLYRRMARHGELLVINSPLHQLRFAGQNARLRDDPMEVLQWINRQYPGPRRTKRTIAPMAFYTVAVLSILTLARPRLFGLMLHHARLRPFAVFAAVAGMIAIAEFSPRMARGIGFLIACLREIRARGRFQAGQIYAWHFPEIAIEPQPSHRHEPLAA